MKPFFILLATFAASILLNKIFSDNYRIIFSGTLALCVMLLFTSIAHFIYAKGMAMMLPPFVPFKHAVVYLTGVLEVGFAIAFMFPPYRIYTAWLLIAFLILVLPANIYASVKQVNYSNATYTGNGLSYLWFRMPMQLLLIWWAWFFGIYLAA
ncbi:DoxX family protein [Mucilaginibacter terrae]|uniref:Membrane protein n=1 Tax=Mucilaginibacter terrae TaxID=1955052 RepID=A0ABU3GXG6_9SPHI|nr:hypothetical protein [Mucilaginibacter terrae]MDT3404350.1 putative membrane protein [Mucilaginibacter terrae]